MVSNKLAELRRELAPIFKMRRKQVECEFGSYFYTYFKSLFEDRCALTQYSLSCEHIFKSCQGEDKTVIDTGCGFGLIALHIACLGAKKVVAVDLDAEKISVFNKILSKLKTPPTNIEIRLMDATELDFDGERFDVAIANNVMSHIRDQTSFMRETNRVVRYGGLLYLHENNNRLYVFPDPKKAKTAVCWSMDL